MQHCVRTLAFDGTEYAYYSLEAICQTLQINLGALALGHKILLENVVRNVVEKKQWDHALEEALKTLFVKRNNSGVHEESKGMSLSYYPGRVLMQDFTGVPAVVDLAALRDEMAREGKDPEKVNPVCQVDLVIDHSVQVDRYNSPNALEQNVGFEMARNQERYRFLKWGQSALDSFRVVPPGKGICHQVNLEYLAPVVMKKINADGRYVLFPDTLVGLDSHTTMINGIGVLGWGVGGIEAESVMLGSPLELAFPEIIGVRLQGTLATGVSATDLVLTLTELFRSTGVVGKWIEFFGAGVSELSVPARATIANMTPEFGATCSLFGIDEKTLAYLRLTGREDAEVDLVAAYTMAQSLAQSDEMPDEAYSKVLTFDLGSVEPCVAGPKRPQDKVVLSTLPAVTQATIRASGEHDDALKRYKVEGKPFDLGHGDVMIAAITSCTNTSNPKLLITAGLLAQKACALGLLTKPWVKTSFAPGSRVVVSYLEKLGLIKPLERLGFYVVGFGCTTCIGNSGPLEEALSQTISEHNLCVSAVLSGNRNFEGRVHPQTLMNWLASPPLVIAYALAGTTCLDVNTDSLGQGKSGAVFLQDIWPSIDEVEEACRVIERQMFLDQYKTVLEGDHHWDALQVEKSVQYTWDIHSTYIQKPDFVKKQAHVQSQVIKARILALFGDSVTTDHISPAGKIAKDSPAGRYLMDKGVLEADFNSYGSRRGNHEVMLRGTFANIRILNRMLDGRSGGYALHVPSGETMSIYECAVRYREEGVPLMVIAGKDYGAGSSRDWAAKGTFGLGVRVVLAISFERIHRSNLIGMGVLPCVFVREEDSASFTGKEYLTLALPEHIEPGCTLPLEVMLDSGMKKTVQVQLRLDTQAEVRLYQQGGVFSKVLEEM